MEVEGKICSQCNEFKIFNDFYKNKTRKDGYGSQCKKCVKNYQIKNAEKIQKAKHEHYEKNKEKYLERTKKNAPKYYEKIKENRRKKAAALAKLKEKEKEKLLNDVDYQKKQRENYLKRHRDYYKRNADLIKEKKKEYRKKNQEREKAYRRNYYYQNIDIERKKARDYWKTEKGRETSYKKRLKRISYKHKVYFSPHERKEILDRDLWTCQNCKIKVHDQSEGNWNTPQKAHIDHIIPLSKGGNSEPENLQVLCRTCNLSKQDKIII